MTRIAMVGGTGAMGKGLGYRFAVAGHDVVLGSRSADRAADAAAEVSEHAGTPVEGRANTDAVRWAEIVVVAVPYDGHTALIESLAGALTDRVVVSCVNPLGFDRAGAYALDVPDHSAAEETARLAAGARVVGAFHTVSAVSLWRHEGPLDHEDVLVCGDDADAKGLVVDLAATAVGRPGVDVGPLRQSRQLEPLTAMLISVNKRYRTRAGIRIGGLP
ncbi:MAG TPA: NADPH-dependent F420 reductase [Nocardioidaceae bacterium]|nr:NADPH-dependent F420 reductase [Nocardioidaceae bacterium]